MKSDESLFQLEEKKYLLLVKAILCKCNGTGISICTSPAPKVV